MDRFREPGEFSKAAGSNEETLGTGCRRCEQALATWQKVHNAAAVEERYQPPAADVRIAKAAFASAGGAKQRRKRAAWSKCCSTVSCNQCWQARVRAVWELDKCSIALTLTN